MINYNLTFNKLKKKAVNNLIDVVYEVEYSLYVYSEEYPSCFMSSGGTLNFSSDELDEDSFIPFEEITKETILEWILEKEEVVSIEEISFVKSSIENVEGRVSYLLSETEVTLQQWNFTNKEPEVAPEPEQTL